MVENRRPGGRAAPWIVAVVLVLGLAHAMSWQPSEPFFNNDETRHVMTGVFFRDLLLDLPVQRPRGYAIDYYLQYPALGLTVWPPLFHGLEGLFMLLFGTSYAVGKALVAIFFVLACTYLFLLVRRTHDPFAAATVVLLFGLAPVVFRLTQHVMLEIPAVTLALAAVYHFVRYLDGEARRDIHLAALASALFALTRFDGLFLLLFFGLALLAQRRFDLLRRRDVWLAAAIALAIVVPLYLPMLAEFGRSHLTVNVQGVGEPVRGNRSLFDILSFYPRGLPRQVGKLTALAGLAGILVALGPARRRACWPYLVLAAATWIVFSPLAARGNRHVIYWVPAFAVFAWEAVDWAARRLEVELLRPALAGLLVLGAIWGPLTRPALYVRGYEDAARYVVANTDASRFSFMDGYLNGGFIYHVRRHDPGRRLWVLRGDKLLYSVLIDPRRGYREYASGEEDILDLLFQYDPELIVVEEPQVRFEMPVATQLRQTLAAHPERFERVKSFPLETNISRYQGVRLDVYRSKLRNPSPARRVAVDMIGLGRTISVDVR